MEWEYYILQYGKDNQQVGRAPAGLSTEKLAERWPNAGIVDGPMSYDEAMVAIARSASEYAERQRETYVSTLADGSW